MVFAGGLGALKEVDDECRAVLNEVRVPVTTACRIDLRTESSHSSIIERNYSRFVQDVKRKLGSNSNSSSLCTTKLNSSTELTSSLR